MFGKYYDNSSDSNRDENIDEIDDRESQAFISTSKNVAESMDFEEMESVMWRKVVLPF